MARLQSLSTAEIEQSRMSIASPAHAPSKMDPAHIGTKSTKRQNQKTIFTLKFTEIGDTNRNNQPFPPNPVQNIDIIF